MRFPDKKNAYSALELVGCRSPYEILQNTTSFFFSLDKVAVLLMRFVEIVAMVPGAVSAGCRSPYEIQRLTES